jgi:hypothetical protein
MFRSGEYTVIRTKDALAFAESLFIQLNCFLHDPVNFTGSLEPMSKILSSSIKEHLAKHGSTIVDGIHPKHIFPQNISELEKICLLELFVLYL